MSLFSIIIKPDAEVDLNEIFYSYEMQKEGLGDRFMKEFDECLQKITANPFHTFNVDKNVRRIVTYTFPYSIFYVVSDNIVVIFAVLHQSRNTDRILKRPR